MVANLYEVNLIVYDRMSRGGTLKQGGLATPKKNRIQLYVGGVNSDIIISVFFHELAHIMCARNSIYHAFHNGTAKQRARAMVYHGLQAERYVDKVGHAMCKEWFGTAIKWRKAYRNVNETYWFKFNQVLPSYMYLKMRGLLNVKKNRETRSRRNQNSQAA